MGKYIDEVRQRAVKKRKELENDPAAQADDFLNMRTVAKFLSTERAFAQSPQGISLLILKFLGYTDAEMEEHYGQLVFEQNTEDPNEAPAYPTEDLFPDPKRIPKPTPKPYPEPDYDWIYDEDEDPEEEVDDEPDPIPEEPPREKLWQYYETNRGEIFKAYGGCNFHLLQEGEWKYCPGLMSYYYDAASDYWEIKESYAETLRRTQEGNRKGQKHQPR